ncbi:hypothetical protein IKG02_00850 [Candidatus Saccharibacteria bacterium]|nr:hypothetical protein [Candidatus Saccharibacteria bacterium]
MKEIGNGFKKIFRNDKDFLVLMIVLFLFGMALSIHSFLNLKVVNSSMYIGYSDIGEFSGGEFLSLWNSGGYRTGGWADILFFAVFGMILAVFHNFFAVQVYNRKGKGFAQIFVIISIMVAMIAFIFLLRLLGKI